MLPQLLNLNCGFSVVPKSGFGTLQEYIVCLFGFPMCLAKGEVWILCLESRRQPCLNSSLSYQVPRSDAKTSEDLQDGACWQPGRLGLG